MNSYSEACTPKQALHAITISAQRLLQSHLVWQV